ncbi:Extracellular Matrix protein PelA [hydrothermal vent metagenome]|uniref:Extracellular Matrix protein PelA n=1 Tax=hydrothermal vent metagenome TaxID=652676 RepID=A0A1W1ECU6_9ZZZZ
MVYYGNDISWSMVGVHDYIIVEPEHIDEYSHGFKTYKNKLYAYVSLGEVQASQNYAKRIKSSWIIGKNKAWKSSVMDLSNADYRAFMLNEVIAALYKKGYRNFFFDTLDSYQIVKKDKKELQKQIDGLSNLILSVHEKYPKSKLILNRGFEVFEKVESAVEAVLFESYYNGLDEKLNYSKFSKDDRQWLDEKLKSIRKSGKDIIALDYAKNLQGRGIEKQLKRLEDNGFIPYISNKDLNVYGKSSKVAQKREVLVLYDGTIGSIEDQGAHLYGSLPLEYMGYIPLLKDINTFDFTQNISERYAGIILWLDGEGRNREKLFRWIIKQSKKKIYTLIFRSFSLKKIDSSLSLLGIGIKETKGTVHTKRSIVEQSSMIGYEMDVKVQSHSYLLHAKNAVENLFTYNEGSSKSTLAAIMPWGGYAVDEVSMKGIGDDNIWIINPFKLYKKALRLPTIPVLDPTTENGLRLLFTHIDGDAIMNRVEFDPTKFSGEVIYEDILTKYQIPHTVSIVGAEVLPDGKYPELSDELVKVSKNIYDLKNVETATHTFSHPFKWGRIKDGFLSDRYRMKVTNYTFSLDYEIEGQLQYIEDNLSSAKTKQGNLVLWTGDCLPQENVLAYTAKHNILNMNGGDTTITNKSPWLYNIAPYGIRKGNYYQIYTGAQNENIYTNEFLGPFWGFKNVIQTFKLTNKPKRFKPIDIYYHFYSGSKTASLRALKIVFDWAMKEKTMPIYTSEFVPKVLAFYTASFSKTTKSSWLFKGMGELRNVRLPTSLGYPDINRSHNVLGYKKEKEKTYVSFGMKNETLLKLNKNESNTTYMISSNAYVNKISNNTYSLKAYVPIETKWHIKEGCALEAKPKADTFVVENSIAILKYSKEKEVILNVKCQ